LKDHFIKPHNLEKFQSGFPNYHVFKIASAGHFPQEEKPDSVIDKLKKWLNEIQEP